MNRQELTMLQSLPLDIKIAKSKLRIQEFVRELGQENVYISFSGGKDSTVLLHLVRQLYPNIVAVYCDTGLEYPEVKQHVYSFDNITVIRPKISFVEVINKYGYPVVSKEQSQYIYQYRTAKSEKTKLTRWYGNKYGRGKISEKWKYLVDAPFKISDKCCEVMKKKPFKEYEKTTNKYPIIGTMACESSLRMTHYLKSGCNSFEEGKKICSRPLGFWTEQDILEYITINKIEIPSVYGDVILSNGHYKLSGVNRTGCIYCLYGINMQENNKLLELEKTHPKLHTYCINNLGLKEVCEFMNIQYNKEHSRT